MLEVRDRAVLPDADIVVRTEDDQRTRAGRVQVGRRAGHPRDEAEKVAREDEQTQGRDERQVGATLGPDDVVDQLLELQENHLEHVLHAPRHQLDATRRDERERRQDDHDEPRVGDRVGDARQAEDRGMLDDLHAQRSAPAARNPSTITAQGSTLSPASSATGCAHSNASSPALAAVNAVRRSPAPTSHAPPATPALDVIARATSQRKFTTASAPPARTPSAAVGPPSHQAGAASTATSAHVTALTRAVTLLGFIELPLRTPDRPKEIHEAGRDPHAETQQREPRLGAEPSIRIVPANQANHGRHDQRDSDRGQLAERFPGALLPGRRHVKLDTSTSFQPAQAVASS